jgi:alpha-L-fucosidase
MTQPSYLKPYAGKDPREANLSFFKEARYGLFLHYGLYSLLGRHEWVQLREQIPVAEYAKLAEKFTAEKFDAAAIAAFARECGMRYINITTRHHDSFCLFKTAHTEFQSVNTPARRDLVAELANACEDEGLALFLYYSHGRDWRHPHAPNNDQYGGSARPEYDPPEPAYAYGEEHDLGKYLGYMSAQVTELLTNYPTVAGIWLDGIAVPIHGDTAAFKTQELYDLVHSLSPHALVSYKQGLLGTEDFFSPEHGVPKAGDNASKLGQLGKRPNTPIEVCTTMIKKPISWGFSEGAEHRTEEEVWEAVTGACRGQYNLLLNTGPLADGSLDPHDEKILRSVGARIEKDGWPA